MMKKSDRVLAAIFLLFGVMIGMMIGSIMQDRNNRNNLSQMLDEEVLRFDCSSDGCSFLVEKSDRSREWTWVPSPEKTNTE